MASEFANPLPGVPHVESPFFNRIFSQPDYDSETMRIAESMRTQGYAVFDFPDPDILAAAERIKASLNPRFAWNEWNEGSPGFVSRSMDGWTFDEDIKRIACNPHVIELLGKLYGRRAFPFQTLNFCVGSQQHVHSDSIHFSSAPERFMCGVWVALEDVDAENGPLFYHPGSHKWPIFANEHIGVNVSTLEHTYAAYPRYEALWNGLIETNGSTPQRFFAKAGQALIWSANLLHGGDTHHDRARTRWSQVTHYYFEGCSYHTPLLSDPYYGRILFREPIDITTGVDRKNIVSGLPVPDKFIAASLGREEAVVPTAFPPPEEPGPAVAAGLRGLLRRVIG